MKERQLLNIVSARIRDRRRDQRLSLDRLASLSGVSKGMLVQIESGEPNPSIAILCKVAAALGVSVADLVQVSGKHPAEVMPAAAPRLFWRGPKGARRRLVGSAGPDMLELWSWELQPGERYEAQAHPQGTEELIHVVRGRLALAFADVSYVVETGGGGGAHRSAARLRVRRPQAGAVHDGGRRMARAAANLGGPDRRPRDVEIPVVGPPLLVIGGSLLYHVAAKSVPKTVAPLAALVGVYFTALVASLVAYAIARRADAARVAIWHPTVAAVGLGVLMIELGFLLTYRAAWPVSMASVMMNGIVAVLLLPVGAALFGETITAVRVAGVVLCLLGLTLLQR